MESESSMPHSQGIFNNAYLEPNQRNSLYWHLCWFVNKEPKYWSFYFCIGITNYNDILIWHRSVMTSYVYVLTCVKHKVLHDAKNLFVLPLHIEMGLMHFFKARIIILKALKIGGEVWGSEKWCKVKAGIFIEHVDLSVDVWHYV